MIPIASKTTGPKFSSNLQISPAGDYVKFDSD